jgi:hypothetical protein
MNILCHDFNEYALCELQGLYKVPARVLRHETWPDRLGSHAAMYMRLWTTSGKAGYWNKNAVYLRRLWLTPSAAVGNY